MRLLRITLILVLSLLAVASAEAAPGATATRARATFAGGCFWCMEAVFDEAPGVVSATSGYTGGTIPNPTYDQVSAGTTGHAEAVEVIFDPAKITYAQLLSLFWKNIDPLTANRQFCDSGSQYRAAVFYHDAEQKRLAEATRAEIAKRFPGRVVTEVVPASRFYRAEAYHQDYHVKNPVRYKYYKYSCGRAKRLQELWGS